MFNDEERIILFFVDTCCQLPSAFQKPFAAEVRFYAAFFEKQSGTAIYFTVPLLLFFLFAEGSFFIWFFGNFFLCTIFFGGNFFTGFAFLYLFHDKNNYKNNNSDKNKLRNGIYQEEKQSIQKVKEILSRVA